MHRSVGLIISALGVSLALVGCGGSGGPNNALLGTFLGSATDGSTIKSVGFQIASNGQVQGTADPIGSSTGAAITGTVTASGQANLTVSSTSGSSTLTGTFGFNSQGVLSASLTQSGSATPLLFTLGRNGNALIYQGSYKGSFSTSAGASGSATLTIGNLGSITGTETPTTGSQSALSGAITTIGVVNATIGSSSQAAYGGAAFNASGQLLVILINETTNVITTFTLTPS